MQYPPFQLHRALQPCPTARRCTKTTDKETGKTRTVSTVFPSYSRLSEFKLVTKVAYRLAVLFDKTLLNLIHTFFKSLFLF